MSNRETMFSRLDASGRFHRDTPAGRIFHPGTDSFREISADDSVHITVTPGNRVSVHVDRLSPLSVRPGGRTRYSIVRAIGHNVIHVVEIAARACRRTPGDHRCHLDCEVSTVEEAAESFYEFSCKAAGAEGCRWSVRTKTEEELVAKVSEHARRVHGVKSVSDTLVRYALLICRQR